MQTKNWTHFLIKSHSNEFLHQIGWGRIVGFTLKYKQLKKRKDFIQTNYDKMHSNFWTKSTENGNYSVIHTKINIDVTESMGLVQNIILNIALEQILKIISVLFFCSEYHITYCTLYICKCFSKNQFVLLWLANTISSYRWIQFRVNHRSK